MKILLEIWLKCKFHAEGYVNNRNNFSPQPCKARKHVNREWTRKDRDERRKKLNGTVKTLLSFFFSFHLQLRIWYSRIFFSFFSFLFTTDLNGLVKFFISTDEINLPPRTLRRVFFFCFFPFFRSILKRNCCDEEERTFCV